MADEYITRYDAETAIAETYSPYGEDGSGDAISREDALREIRHVPAADVRPVVHAHWVLDADGVDMCSNCEANALQRMRFNAQGWTWTCPTVRTMFCPYCGAVMDEDVDDGGMDKR